MRLRIIAMGFCLLSLSLASAQTKVSGTAQCAKPDLQQKVDVPDHPGHSLSISQSKCSWTKPAEIGGMQGKDGVTTASEDIHGNTATGHGYYVDNMANGDKLFVRFQGTTSMKEGTANGTWSYINGTGKFKGIKGKGTYKGKAAQDGSITYDVEGEYTLPQ